MPYPDNFSQAAYERVYGGRDYETPEPDEVEKFARGLASNLISDFEFLMKRQFPGFTLDWSDKPADYLVDGLADLAYHFVSICEREREQ